MLTPYWTRTPQRRLSTWDGWGFWPPIPIKVTYSIHKIILKVFLIFCHCREYHSIHVRGSTRRLHRVKISVKYNNHPVKKKKQKRQQGDTERWVATVGESSNNVCACGLFALGLKSASGVLYSPGAAGTGTVWANSLLFSVTCSVGASVGIWEWGRESE